MIDTTFTPKDSISQIEQSIISVSLTDQHLAILKELGSEDYNDMMKYFQKMFNKIIRERMSEAIKNELSSLRFKIDNGIPVFLLLDVR